MIRVTILKVALITWLACIAPIYAQDEGELAGCDKWNTAGAMGVGCVLKARKIYFRDFRNNRYETLIDLLSEHQSENDQLIVAVERQRDLLDKYYASECGLVGKLMGGGGSWPSTHATRCEANLMDRQFRRVDNALQCMQKHDRSTRFLRNQAHLECLYQLTHLALE